VDVLKDIEVEETVGFRFFDVWASGGPQGESGSAFRDAIYEIGAIERYVEGD